MIMNDSTLIKQVIELTKRVDCIQNQTDKINELGLSFWVPVFISIIAVLISIWAIYSNKEQSKKNSLDKIKSNIDLAKAQLETLTMEIASLKAKTNKTNTEEKELEIKLQIINSVIERLLNNYENGCDKFFKKQVKKQDFVDSYHNDVALYITQFPDKFTEPLTQYKNMLKYYNKYYKNIKA